MSGGRLQRKLLIAFAFSLLTPSLVGQQKLMAQRQVQSPAPSPSSPAALPPEQMPASPPAVEFHGGQLTIMASNSTLGDILRAVRKETGASVDVPGNATERVVGQFGPGPARDVLASLLNGSHFNYVLLGSAENPFNLDRVILTSRSGVNDQAAQQAGGPTSQNQAAAMPSPQSADMDMSSDDSMDAPETVGTDEPGTPGQPDDQQQQQANPPGQAGGVKTPEQLLQELQQRQLQIQQQQQQQGNPNAPTTPGPQRPPQ